MSLLNDVLASASCEVNWRVSVPFFRCTDQFTADTLLPSFFSDQASYDQAFADHACSITSDFRCDLSFFWTLFDYSPLPVGGSSACSLSPETLQYIDAILSALDWTLVIGLPIWTVLIALKMFTRLSRA